MDLDVIPDLTMLGQDDPHGRALIRRPPTVGQLAARLVRLAGCPAQWWHRVGLDPSEPVRISLDAAGPVETWLATWPPGHRTRVHDHGGTGVSMVLAGELVEVAIEPGGVTERPLRANRVRVHGGAHTHELSNPGPAYAITLHAR